MQRHRKLTTIIATCVLLSAFAGCNESAKAPAEPVETPPPVVESESPQMASRFQQTTPKGDTAVDSAIQLSKQHAKLAEQMMKLKEEKEALEQENQQLNARINELQAKLDRSQKELKEANDLLVEMGGELNSWKENVLGFRSEMRDAERAQLEALVKILTLLGGETRAQPALGEDTDTVAMTSSQN